MTSNSTGVLWNDEMNDFSLPGLSDFFGLAPTPANYIVPGKRPMSSTSPIVVFNPSGNVEDVNVSKNSFKNWIFIRTPLTTWSRFFFPEFPDIFLG